MSECWHKSYQLERKRFGELPEIIVLITIANSVVKRQTKEIEKKRTKH